MGMNNEQRNQPPFISKINFIANVIAQDFPDSVVRKTAERKASEGRQDHIVTVLTTSRLLEIGFSLPLGLRDSRDNVSLSEI
jgi:hypothetical protein